MNEQLISDYKNTYTNGKTERECASQIITLAEKNGYRDISEFDTLKPGDKVYIQKMKKTVALSRSAVIRSKKA